MKTIDTLTDLISDFVTADKDLKKLLQNGNENGDAKKQHVNRIFNRNDVAFRSVAYGRSNVDKNWKKNFECHACGRKGHFQNDKECPLFNSSKAERRQNKKNRKHLKSHRGGKNGKYKKPNSGGNGSKKQNGDGGDDQAAKIGHIRTHPIVSTLLHPGGINHASDVTHMAPIKSLNKDVVKRNT
ncbi:unnamed protein product [Ambrosiozyma monospora]|uniref:Unnamed protein product n=1 Tax=Ambrosiozyma monospora TaxID=43982 RepID=A0ACB5U709_AMBMO|nr:unnamed protein product [Ambrosiozyma monospora]